MGFDEFLFRNVHRVLFLVERQGFCDVDFMDVLESLLEVNLVLVTGEAVQSGVDFLSKFKTAIIVLQFLNRCELHQFYLFRINKYLLLFNFHYN